MDLERDVKALQDKFLLDLTEARQTGNFDKLYLNYFSKSHGATIALLQVLPKMSSDEKRVWGPILNALQEKQKSDIEEAKYQYNQNLYNDPTIDLTIPQVPQKVGRLHPTTQTFREMNEFFRYLGFSVIDGPEIETALYNFRKLNLPEGHPANDLQDSLFIHKDDKNSDNDILLRTQTSSVEARILSEYKPPIRIVVPGNCFRNETLNMTNSDFFTQFQGVVVDKGITIQHLKTTLTQFHKFLFGDDVVLRFRYKYYPEVSPGMGVDMKCKFCEGTGCTTCKQRGWIEVLGSGMIHYNTLKMCGIDPEIYTGYAFGIGSDRQVMMKHGITDIRALYGAGLVYK